MHIPLVVMNTTTASSSTCPFTSQIEFHHCHAKGYIASHCSQRTFIIGFKDDGLLEDTKELLAMDILESDYKDDPSVIYKDDSLLNKDYLLVMRCIFSTPNDSNSWKRTSIFHNIILVNRKSCKLAFDGDCSKKVICGTTIDRFRVRLVDLFDLF